MEAAMKHAMMRFHASAGRMGDRYALRLAIRHNRLDGIWANPIQAGSCHAGPLGLSRLAAVPRGALCLFDYNGDVGADPTAMANRNGVPRAGSRDRSCHSGRHRIVWGAPFPSALGRSLRHHDRPDRPYGGVNGLWQRDAVGRIRERDAGPLIMATDGYDQLGAGHMERGSA